MTRRLVVVGAGGFGRETLDVIDAVNAVTATRAFEVLGFLDDAPSEAHLKRLAARGSTYLGTVESWLEEGHDAEYVIGVGSPSSRRLLAERFDRHDVRAATLVHPRAGIGSIPTIGSGTVICAGVEVSTNVSLGRHVHLNPSATIGHDTVLGAYVSINPSATVSGECRIAEGVLIGAGAVVLQGLVVNANATVGACACVTRDVRADATVKGVPAR